MTDEELAKYCGLADDDPLRDHFFAWLTPERRALYERQASFEASATSAGCQNCSATHPQR
jgi:hypothetical protein